MNVYGIGTDIVECQRFERSKEAFVKRNFTKKEIEYFEKKNFSNDVIAGHFASKEAVVKALGTGFRDISPKDIEITHDDLGKPLVNIFLKDYSKYAFMLTISHTKEVAVAFVIAYI